MPSDPERVVPAASHREAVAQAIRPWLSGAVRMRPHQTDRAVDAVLVVTEAAQAVAVREAVEAEILREQTEVWPRLIAENVADALRGVATRIEALREPDHYLGSNAAVIDAVLAAVRAEQAQGVSQETEAGDD